MNRHPFGPIVHRAVIAFLCAWLLVVGWLAQYPSTQGSPDEAGNVFFIQTFRDSGSLQASTGLTANQSSFWHPRSVTVDGTVYEPGSFLGLILVDGWIDRLGWKDAHQYVLPLLAAFALWGLYQILVRFWVPSWAMLGTGLVAFHPVWLQFQTLPYFHNGAFASFLLLAGWRLMRLWEAGTSRNAIWFGLTYGAALFFRPVEVLWTGPLVAIVLLAQRKWVPLLIAAAVTILAQLPWLVANHQLYGTYTSSGYAAGGVSDLIPGSASGSQAPALITPLGGWSWNWLSSVWHYLILLVPAWSAAVAVAAIFYVRRIATNRPKLLKISLVTLPILFCLVYYGSWDLYPLSTAEQVGSLASYARYWILLYVAMVVGVLWLLKRIQNRWWLALVITGLFVSQLTTIMVHPNAGIVARFKQDESLSVKRQQILALTPTNSAIVAGHMDKVLFPDRLVAFQLPSNEADWEALYDTLRTRQVFLYVTPRQYNRDRIEIDLRNYNLHFGDTFSVGNDRLWEIRAL